MIVLSQVKWDRSSSLVEMCSVKYKLKSAVCSFFFLVICQSVAPPIHLCFTCICSHPLRTWPWALVGWAKAEVHLSPVTVTTCRPRVWWAAARQPHTCRTKWTDRFLVSGLFLHLVPFFPPSLFPLSSSHLGCLATVQTCAGGCATEGWCHLFVLDLNSFSYRHLNPLIPKCLYWCIDISLLLCNVFLWAFLLRKKKKPWGLFTRIQCVYISFFFLTSWHPFYFVLASVHV